MAATLNLDRAEELEAKLDNALDREVEVVMRQVAMLDRAIEYHQDQDRKALEKQIRLDQEQERRAEASRLKAQQAQERKRNADRTKEAFLLQRCAVQEEKRQLALLRQDRLAREREEFNERLRDEAEAKRRHIQHVRSQLNEVIEHRKRDIIERALTREERVREQAERLEQEMAEKTLLATQKKELLDAKRQAKHEQQEYDMSIVVAKQEEKSNRSIMMKRQREMIVQRLTEIKDDHAAKKNMLREALHEATNTGNTKKVKQYAELIKANNAIPTGGSLTSTRSSPDFQLDRSPSGPEPSSARAQLQTHRSMQQLGEYDSRYLEAPQTLHLRARSQRNLRTPDSALSRARQEHLFLQEVSRPAGATVEIEDNALAFVSPLDDHGTGVGVDSFTSSPSRRAFSQDSPQSQLSAASKPTRYDWGKGAESRTRSHEGRMFSPLDEAASRRTRRRQRTPEPTKDSSGVYKHLMSRFAAQVKQQKQAAKQT